MSYGVVYLIRNGINGKGYVGQTTQKPRERFVRHCSTGNTPLCYAIRKYGRENFTVEVLASCDSREEMNRLEALNIAARATMVPQGYNVLPDGGAIAGSSVPREVVERRVAKLRGIKRSPEFSAKLSAALRGRKITWGNKIAEANRGRAMSDTQAAALAAGRAAPKSDGYARAENNGNARLDWAQVRAIRKAHADEDVSQDELARRFGVKQTAISRIVRRITWTDDPILRPEED